MKVSEIFLQSLAIRDQLYEEPDLYGNPIDKELLPVLPYKTGNDIRLIIVGQDPTIQNAASRKNIEYTLNLDKGKALCSYINSICRKLGFALNNVYATNVFKYFYRYPPQKYPELLRRHAPLNISLLQKEIADYPAAAILTLGEPVLNLLSNRNADMKHYWGYRARVNNRGQNFSFCAASDNKLHRDFFPFVHIRSSRATFYSTTRPEYERFIHSKIEGSRKR